MRELLKKERTSRVEEEGKSKGGGAGTRVETPRRVNASDVNGS